MTWELDDREFEAVLRQGAEKQYGYFVGHCADWGEVWGLAVEGTDWAMVENDAGVVAGLAVWPHPRYAEACRRGEWSHREPTAIPVHAFVDELIPQLLADELQVAVFPLPDGRYTPVAPRQLRSDLEAELMRIE
jgi:hypothetical protein